MINHQFPTIVCKLLYIITFVKFCFGADTLFSNQTIVNGRTLVSQNQVFELGFFAPGASTNRSFLGIWYKNTPDVVVWVANRNDPVIDPRGVFLAVASNGTLAISTPGNVIWSSSSSRLVINPVLKLLDTGNLVIVENTREGSSDSYLWQSFDVLCDTRLPGMKMVDNIETGLEMHLTSWRDDDDPSPGEFVYKIENHGLPELVILRGGSKTYRTGKWNGLYFSGLPIFPNSVFKGELVFERGRLISIVQPYQSSVVTRFTLEKSGLLQTYTMNERRDEWNLLNTLPRDACDNYSRCGPNSICRVERGQICECLRGFAPRSQNDWDIQDWAGGCARISPLNCVNGDGFLELRRVKLPDMLQFRLNTSMSLIECRDECLRSCNCTAYANSDITNGGSGCLMWFGDLIDTRDVSEEDDKQIIYIRLPNSELGSSTDVTDMKRKRSRKLKVIMLTASGVLVASLIGVITLLRIRRGRKAAKKNNEDLELPLFKLATIATATNKFSGENMIGEGGFGLVFRGILSGEEEIAVKRLSKNSGQGLEEFKNEVTLIAKLQHRNLVRLLGCCIEGDERMLIYEFLQNKSLDYFIFDKERRVLLTWPKRLNIIMGIARGLLYLHHDSRLKIIHRDLKTSNILLDEDLNPKISDFGLARIFGLHQTIDRTKRVVGTYGYMAPEYAMDGKFSIKSDIFSLGVLLLEIVSGKKNRSFAHYDHHHSLLGHAWLRWKENKYLELMDDCLKDSFIEAQVKRCIHVGLLCVQNFAENRPDMPSVLFMLGHDGVVLPEPKEPGFFVERSSGGSVRTCTGSAINEMSEMATITITEIVAR